MRIIFYVYFYRDIWFLLRESDRFAYFDCELHVNYDAIDSCSSVTATNPILTAEISLFCQLENSFDAHVFVSRHLHAVNAQIIDFQPVNKT